MQRRSFLKSGAVLAGGLCAEGAVAQAQTAAKRANRLKQSVCAMVFGRSMSFEDSCREAARIGIKGYDFVEPKDWPTLKKYGLVPSMYPIGPVADARKGEGLNQKERHDEWEKTTFSALKEAKAGGCPNLIAFAGMKGKVSYEEGADLNVAFLNRVKAAAEDAGVNICLEILSHPNQMFDHTKWGVDIVKRVNSPRVGILYDTFHAQVLEGNIADTIRANIQWIKHVHTAGNPGRHQLDEKQEVNWPFIGQVLAELNYQGFVGHEYTTREGTDVLAALKKSFDAFDV